MPDRRSVLKGAAALGAGAVLGSTLPGAAEAAVSRAPEAAVPSATGAASAGAERAALADAGGAAAAPPEDGTIRELNSTSGVFIPPRGRSFLKFSFNFPEPSVAYRGLEFSFRLYTFENAYGPDPAALEAHAAAGGGWDIVCRRLIFAGGLQSAEGGFTAELRPVANGVECRARAHVVPPAGRKADDFAIKAITAIVRGVPRGRVSPGGGSFFDPRENELLFGYPFGGDSLFLAGGMNTPLTVIEAEKPAAGRNYFSLSARDTAVHAHRFYFQPGPDGYRVELTYEPEGWRRQQEIVPAPWRLTWVDEEDAAFRPHFAHVEQVFDLPDWRTRRDVPAWLRNVALVVALHGMDWTGYIFNDFAKMSRTLDWVAGQIPAERVLVFLPAWDGRYYWNYPAYQPDPRLGGPEGMRRLIDHGHSQGFRFMPMFGSDAANDRLPDYEKVAAGATILPSGRPYFLDWVDWDNDRHDEGNSPFMNLGVAAWRDWLGGRISAILSEYHADGYFLDIAGGWVNNRQGDIFTGIRELVTGLRRKHPHAIACGEMSYDALLGFIPLFQVFSERGYPPAFKKYARAFEHLSTPAPGRGSTGVYEAGFGRFNSKTLNLDPAEIPTITVVDDTFAEHRDIMAAIIRRAKERAGIA